MDCYLCGCDWSAFIWAEEHLALIEAFRNQHIVFIGDSLSRYHYISFVYHLSHSQPLSEHVRPSPVREQTFDSWIHFYDATNGFLYPELCDCFKITDPNAFTEHIFENRYYHHAGHNITVTYYEFFGVFFQGHWSPPHSPAANASADKPTLAYPNKEAVPPYWKYEPHELYANHMSYLSPPPTIVLMNTGLWPNHFTNVAYADRVLDSFKQVDMFIWRTTTPQRVGSYRSESGPQGDLVACSRPRVHCMNVSWALGAKHEHYWDNVHFIEPVYHRFNMQLIGMVRNYTAAGRGYRRPNPSTGSVPL